MAAAIRSATRPGDVPGAAMCRAAVVEVRVADAARFLRARLRALTTGARKRVADAAGLLIAVDDAQGLAWVDADTGLGGIHYVRPALRGCDPFPAPEPLGLRGR